MADGSNLSFIQKPVICKLNMFNDNHVEWAAFLFQYKVSKLLNYTNVTNVRKYFIKKNKK